METPGLKVLLIEPDKNQSAFLSEVLMDLGFRVITAKNVDSAIQKLLCHSPSLIICQKELNDDSGFLLFSMLRNNLSDLQTPFILLLNVFDKKDLSLGVEMGIDSFLFPPFEREKIAHILQNQLEKNSLGKSDTYKQFKLFKIIKEIKRVTKNGGLFYSKTFSDSMYVGQSNVLLGPLQYKDISDGPLAGKGLNRLTPKKGISELYGK